MKYMNKLTLGIVLAAGFSQPAAIRMMSISQEDWRSIKRR